MRAILPGILATAMATVSCGGFSMPFPELNFEAECEAVSADYDVEHAASATLLESVPESTDNYAMALVLDADGLNAMFAELLDADLPTVEASTEILRQELGVGVRPELPVLSIGGTPECPDCLTADMGFRVGATLGPVQLDTGGGSLTAQLPVRLVASGDRETQLVAQFQDIEIVSFEMETGEDMLDDVAAALEPLVNEALTDFLQNRFRDIEIATLRSWELGAGDVLLAGRGPFVDAIEGTVTIAMQTNLPLGAGSSVQAMSSIPEGADVGLRIHPALISAMARRMVYEGEIASSYDESGAATDEGMNMVTLSSIEPGRNGMLQVDSTIWRASDPCGSAGLRAQLSMAASPSGVTFNVDDVEVRSGTGSGVLLEYGAAMAGDFLDRVIETMQVTVNYDEVFSGEAESDTELETFEATLDDQGFTLLLSVGN